jgi:hypothetical protein
MPRLWGRGTTNHENRGERTLSLESYFRIKTNRALSSNEQGHAERNLSERKPPGHIKILFGVRSQTRQQGVRKVFAVHPYFPAFFLLDRNFLLSYTLAVKRQIFSNSSQTLIT